MNSKILKMQKVERINNSPKIAWLLQGADAYYQPLMKEFKSFFSQSKVFTASWSGFLPGFENSFDVKQVGNIKILKMPGKFKGYSPSFTYLPLNIINYLVEFKPDVVLTTAFSIWTIIAVFFKVFFRWKVIILYDGSSPGVEYKNYGLRLFLRRFINKFVDAYITNNKAGKSYLIEVNDAPVDKVFARTYLIPDNKVYSSSFQPLKIDRSQLKKPIFIFAGHLIPRKGVKELLQACLSLQQKKYQDYTLLIVGDGLQRQELENFVAQNNLQDNVRWVGYVNYEQVGAYYQQADIFVFPTLEDVWGLVAVEAMMFGKPILCSQWAGAAEMVKDGENGYIFDPYQPEKLAELMSEFINRPDLIASMGAKSQEIMANYTPNTVAKNLAEVVEFVLNK